MSFIKTFCIFAQKIKIMETTELSKTKVGELVAKDYRTAGVFKKFGIDFCCGGGISIEEACRKKNIHPENVLNELKKLYEEKPTPQNDYDKWDLGFLIDYIVNVHHKYVEENIPLLLEFSKKVARVHGDANPEVIRIHELVQESVNELVPHMKKEELILFPYIKKLEEAAKNNLPAPVPPFGTVQNPVNAMIHEHDMVGEYFKEMEKISNNFLPPEHACNTYRVLYAKLKEFYEDLILHIHLENNILFPKAIALEKK